MPSFPALSAIGAASILLLFTSSASAAKDRLEGPSFNCSRATSDSEKAICANPELAALDQRIAIRYAALREQLGPRAALSLRQDQEWFIASREESETEDLVDTLRERLAFLNAVGASPQPGIVGTWRNVAGDIVVTRDPSGTLSFEASTSAPVTGRWVCELSGNVSPQGDKWSADITKPTEDTITFERQGPVLRVVEPEGSHDYCGLNGGLDGDYYFIPGQSH